MTSRPLQLKTAQDGLTFARSIFYSLAVSSLLAAPVIAQIGGSGSIQGVVSDPSGAVIPAANVLATNVATGTGAERQTTAAGFYVVSPLPAGRYTVTVSASGFQTMVRENVVVDALSVVGFNVIMKIGSAAETVTVSESAPALNTSDSRTGQTVRNEVYTALPLAMGSGGSTPNSPRDPTTFIGLMPGVQNFGSGNTGGDYGGSQTGSQEVYVEGIPLTNAVLGGETRYLALGVNIEAVDQFQFEGAGAAVMFQGQGASNFTLKSGTNQFHGAFFDYLRNTALDARGFFAAARPIQKQNEFGVSIGGPIVRNRIFFFSAYSGYRNRQITQPAFFSIPTPLARTGNFSEFPVQIYDPLTTNCAAGPCTRAIFAGNVIPSSRISKISSNFQSFMVAPTSAGVQNNLRMSQAIGFNNDGSTNKVDANLTDAHRITGMFSYGYKTQAYPIGGNGLPLPYTTSRSATNLFGLVQVGWTWVANANMVNQLTVGGTRFSIPLTNITIDGKFPIKAGLTGLPAGEADSAFPAIAFNGPNSPTQWRGPGAQAFDEFLNQITIQDNLQWTRGKHSVTFGGQVQIMQANEKQRTYGSVASWTFSNTQTAGFSPTGTLLTATGNSYASYLLGAVNSNSITEDSSIGTTGQLKTYAWWIQDNFRVSPRLTVNLGLRHDLMTPWVEAHDRMSWLNPDLPNPAIGGFPGALQFAGDGPNSCNCRTRVGMYRKNFSPRIGLAYSLGRKTVVRGGWGLSVVRKGAVGGRDSGKEGTNTLGYAAVAAFTSLDAGISPAYYWENGVPPYQKPPVIDSTLNTGFYTGTPQGGPITYDNAPRDAGRPPLYANWSFGFQRLVTESLMLDVSWVGNNGHRLAGGARGKWDNQIRPEHLVLGNLLQRPATAANLTEARRILPSIALPYANFEGTISQMLRPFPQYSSIQDIWGNVGNINWNSLQISGRQALIHGLLFNFNYTFSKGFNDLGQRTGWASEKAQSPASTHVVNVLAVYELPFGKNSGPVVRALASGWRISGITTFYSGVGFGTISAPCNLPNAGTCTANFNPNFSGPVRINGDYGSGNVLGTNATRYLDRNAFANPAAFTYGDTPLTLAQGLRGPSTFSQNLSLQREFRITEAWKFSLRGDALNAFNLVQFNSPDTNIASAAFGTITGQSILPRVIQVSARITF